MIFPQHNNLIQELTATGRRSDIVESLIVLQEHLLFILFDVKYLLYTMLKYPNTSFEISGSMYVLLSNPLWNEMFALSLATL